MGMKYRNENTFIYMRKPFEQSGWGTKFESEKCEIESQI